MTDDLVARLREKARSKQTYGGVTLREAADALEAQAKEISQYKVDINEALLDCKSLRARIAELEAENAELSTRCQALFSLLPNEIRIGDIQKAVAALKGEEG